MEVAQALDSGKTILEPHRHVNSRIAIRAVGCGGVQSFAEIAEREGKVERHIRLLTPLAFITPCTLAAIIDGTGPHDATVTALAQAVPYRWDRPAGKFSE
jgi:hypothetical protein